MSNHHIIYIPGLNDQLIIQHEAVRLLPLYWRLRGFRGHIVYPHWEEGQLDPKLERVIAKIDGLARQGHRVSLIGQSAGGSLALNAFAARKDTVVGLINLTGRLHIAGTPALEVATRHNPAFAKSVEQAEVIVQTLSQLDRQRIMTIRPYIDYIVPATSVSVDGATNLVSPIWGHTLGGAINASFASGQWLAFLSALES